MRTNFRRMGRRFRYQPQGCSETNGRFAAMAGLSACTKLPTEKIVPYVRPPEELFLAGRFSMPRRCPSVRRCHRMCSSRVTWAVPRKSKAIQEHPGSRAEPTCFMQGSILNLYDPDVPERDLRRTLSNWADFRCAMGNARVELGTNGRTSNSHRTVTSPTLGAQIKKLLANYPDAKWHQYEALRRGDSVREGHGCRLAGR